MGTSESGECSFNCVEAGQAHHVGCWQKEDRSGTKGTVGKGEGGEEGCLEQTEIAAAAADSGGALGLGAG